MQQVYMSHSDQSNSPVIKEMGITGGNYTTKTKRRRSESNSRMIRQRQLGFQSITPCKVNIQSLPEDIALRITSKLTLKEAAQMCVLSSMWRQACALHPNLYFGIQTVLGSHANTELIFTDPGKRTLTTNKFIERVDAILKNHCTTQVNKFAIEFGLLAEHASHIDRWVSFAIASKARVVVLDLSPNKRALDGEDYDFPFQLFDGHSGSHLQALLLNCLTLGPPPDFCGFANLKMLDLAFLIVSQDLQHLLSKCCVLEWLRIQSCLLQLPGLSSLCVQEPLYRLQYLCVHDCAFREIEFRAPNLMTFEYKGFQTSINLNESLKLKAATMRLYEDEAFEYVLTWIPCILPQVDTLYVQLWFSSKISEFTQSSPLKFIQLRHLTIEISTRFDPNSVFHLAYLLKAAPLLEDLHFDMFSYDSMCHADLDDIMDLPHYHLKTVCIDGFCGTYGQVELAKYILKNAMALEHFIVKPCWKPNSTSSVYASFGRQEANKKLVPLDSNRALKIL